MKKILYTGAFKYPDGDAAGKRVNTIVGSLSDFYDFTVTNWGKGNGKYDCNELNLKNKNIFSKLISYYFMGFKTFNKIKSEMNNFDLIILYNPPFLFSILMLVFAKFKKINIILENTEWYDSNSFPGGKYGPLSLENWLRMRVSYPLFKNIIVMSKFLNEYYTKSIFKRNVVVIPPFSKLKRITKNIENEFITMIYAGSPGKKDRLDRLITDLSNLNDNERSKFKFIFVGFTEKEFLDLYPKMNNYINILRLNVLFTGRIKMSEVESYYSISNYSIFFRENKRYAWAGFPSKFVESISFSTPVISNPVGDISHLINDYGYIYDENLFRNIVTKKENNSIENNIIEAFSDNGIFSVNHNALQLKCFFDGLIV